MSVPRIGVVLPTRGPDPVPDAVVAVARTAELLDLHAVAACERLLVPAPGPHGAGDADGGPGPDGCAFDPIEILTWAAAHTGRIRVATGVVAALFQSPLVLARRLAALDRLSGGRLDVGVGQGWLPQEFCAAGVEPGRRGEGFAEHLAAMRACWGPDPVEHHGPYYRIPPSSVGPKPAGGPLALLVGAVARPAVERAARIGDGFVAAVRDWERTRKEIHWYRTAGGRGRIVVQVPLTGLGGDPARAFAERAAEAVGRAAALDADEVHFALPGRDAETHVRALEAFAARG
ncbi:LLM class flavin-dependent oxidoreductase [Actinomadura atramentaria]|uniref:LLM class flavin-dependent oxidoreductase n=1 Tax=Actinomadura atramentaria TaxID=1990 RepID=UPI0003A51E95|nr:LLM class flavin-dependent oxidoreductase [Actinomadura atramentaria]